MKLNSIAIVSFFMICFLTLTSMNRLQETTIFEGVYDGKEDYGYNFIGTEGDDDSEYTMTFQKVNAELLKSFDLNSDALIGTKFKVTYIIKIETTKDEDGYEDVNEIYTITGLVQL